DPANGVMFHALSEILVGEAHDTDGRRARYRGPVARADRDPGLARHLVGQAMPGERGDHRNDPFGNALGDLRQREVAVDLGFRVLVESATDADQVAIIERAPDRGAGNTMVAQVLCPQDRAACYKSAKLFPLTDRLARHVTNPMT